MKVLPPHRLTDGPWLPPATHPAWSRLKQLARALVLLALVGGLLFWVHRPLLLAYADFFEVNEPTRSDLIVLLMGGPDHRPARAAALYREGFAPTVLYCTSGLAISELSRESQLTQEVLLREGVPSEQVVRLPDIVTSTRDEAFAVKRYLQAHPEVKKILLVTSAFHTRRTRWVFRKVLADLPVEVNAAAAYSSEMDRDNWYKHDEGLITYFIESVKLLVYWIRY